MREKFGFDDMKVRMQILCFVIFENSHYVSNGYSARRATHLNLGPSLTNACKDLCGSSMCITK